METIETVISELSVLLNQKSQLREEYSLKISKIEEEIDMFKSSLLSRIGLSEGDLVTVISHEYRDDSIHCFAVAQSYSCFIKGVYLHEPNKYDNESYLIPKLVKTKTAKRFFTPTHSWTLKKDDKIILEHIKESRIIPGTYKEEELDTYRARLYESQKIR